MIEVQDLAFRYPGEKFWAIKEINLTIQQGELLVVVGPSGCGKSTLALALGGYLFNQYAELVTGEIFIDGRSIRQMPLYDIADIVGLVQQNPEAQFCTLTVQDELVFGLENRKMQANEITERLEWAMGVTSCRHLLGRSLASLSGGEKQKIAITAMLMAKPQVLIFDEPTSNLDPSATADIFKVLIEVRRQTAITMIVIEHKTDYLEQYQPRMVEMEAGRLIHHRTPVSWLEVEPQVNPPGYRSGHSIPVLTMKDVEVGYNHHPLLTDINLDIYPGEFVAVMGDNGSGKTTLIQAVMGFLKPLRGQIQVCGEDTLHTPVSQIARQVGLVFQNPAHQLFTNSIWDEAIFALKNFDMLDPSRAEWVNGLIQLAGLDHRRDDHPFRLSYGQMRRLNLISVVSYQPGIYLLDEILIGQDMGNAASLLRLMRSEASHGSAVVMVNHHPAAALMFASRLIFLEKGRILIDQPIRDGFNELARLGRREYLPPGWKGN